MTRMLTRTLLMGIMLALSACTTTIWSNELNEQQQAWLLTKEYTAAAAAANAYVLSPVAEPKVVKAIGQADTIAYAYVEQTNLAAQALSTVPEEERPVAQSAFTSIYQRALAAYNGFVSLLTPAATQETSP